MIASVSRPLLRRSLIPIRSPQAQLSRRFLSTAPPHLKSRSWKSSAARWGIAIGGIYWYNTSSVFAEEPAYAIQDAEAGEAALPTLESLSPAARFRPPHPEDVPTVPAKPSASSPPSINPKSSDPPSLYTPEQSSSTAVVENSPSDPGALEEEAGQQGAFNEETGEINWDCPCLGGMAHGPCGPEFREAFSCFVYSKDEPKGMDCIDKFKGMQECFREHPEVYGAELQDDDEEVYEEGQDVDEGIAAATSEGETAMPGVLSNSDAVPETKSMYDTSEAKDSKSVMEPEKVAQPRSEDTREKKQRALNKGNDIQNAHGKDKANSESEELVPKAAHDAR